MARSFRKPAASTLSIANVLDAGKLEISFHHESKQAGLHPDADSHRPDLHGKHGSKPKKGAEPASSRPAFRGSQRGG